MFEQDSIVRQIRQFTNALEKVLFKKKEGELEEAQALIQQSLKELYPNDDHKKFHELSLEETISSLEKEGKFSSELALVVADLLFEEAGLLNDNESQHCFSQAFLLYKKALKDPDVAYPLQAIQKINLIENELDPPILNNVNQLIK